MSLGLERGLVEILNAVRGRTNVTFKRFHPIDVDRGIYLDYNRIVSLSPASTRRLSGVKDIIIDAKNGGSDPVRKALGSAKKCSGDFEHAALRAVRNSAHAGIHAVRSAEASLLTGYNQIASPELTNSEQFQLLQAQQHLPEIPVLSAALQAIGQSMARVDLTLPTDKQNNILTTGINGEIINQSVPDIILASISRFLLGSSSQNPDN
jgi:hypothetical protein